MSGTINLSAEDPLSALEQPFGDPVTLPDGMAAAEALRTLWEPVLGEDAFGDMDDGGRVTVLRVFAEEEDRLDSGLSLMSDLGLEVGVSRTGLVELQERPDPTNTDAVTVVREFLPDPGVAASLDLARSGSDKPYNRVVVLLERPDLATLRAEASITDPASDIHEDRIGRRVAPYYRTSQVGDQAALNALAQQLLIEYVLNVDTVRHSAIPDHRLDAGDVIYTREPRTRTDDRFRINRVSHPVTTGAMSLDTSRVLPLFLLAA
jgi:hypothetical protein